MLQVLCWHQEDKDKNLVESHTTYCPVTENVFQGPRKEGHIFSVPGGLVSQNIFHQKRYCLSWILKKEVMFR